MKMWIEKVQQLIRRLYSEKDPRAEELHSKWLHTQYEEVEAKCEALYSKYSLGTIYPSTLPPLEPLYGYDAITGPNPTAWQKLENLILHTIRIEERLNRIEETNHSGEHFVYSCESCGGVRLLKYTVNRIDCANCAGHPPYKMIRIGHINIDTSTRDKTPWR
jgi:hypothetical protein